MTGVLLPAIWLIVLIVGLPQLSETIYTPSLPDITDALRTKEATVEYTLTVYLLGFAIGMLFWGKISDKLGRKPCVIAGFLVFIVGCIGCYVSNSIEMLIICRLIQGFGGSVGSVLAQAICRDSFHGAALGKVYSTVGTALAIFPAIGPLCGGFIAEIFGWRNIFIFLFAEGSFYLIKGLGLSPSNYGISFTFIAISTMLGGLFSKKLHDKHSSKKIMSYGIFIITSATTIFSFISLINHFLWTFPSDAMVLVAIFSQMGCTFGICMVSTNALALALVDYKYAVGTASSLFGFFYCCLTSLFTFFMGFLHNGTLLPMPLYFFALSWFMVSVNNICLSD